MMKSITLPLTLFLILYGFFLPHLNAAETVMLQTKNKLSELNTKITQLKQGLTHAKTTRAHLNQELAETEKQMGKNVYQLRGIEQDIDTKKHKILALEESLHGLNSELRTQQNLLAEHVRARYKMNVHQPLQWLMTQDNLDAISRLFTYFEYLIQSRQTLITHIVDTQQKINVTQVSLNKELGEQHQLEQTLHRQQAELNRHKQHHQALIQRLSQDIQTKKHQLVDYQRNKDTLSRLLKTLAAQNLSAEGVKPFSQMRRALMKPIHVANNRFQHVNQGLTFFAVEGTPVTAVYPGKVVFSDWLNGYGLLLIIDHGQGYMTLYAHNQSLFKSKGSSVLQGEQIAAVGHSGGLKENGLYFEVRHRGRAIPALDWLSLA